MTVCTGSGRANDGVGFGVPVLGWFVVLSHGAVHAGHMVVHGYGTKVALGGSACVAVGTSACKAEGVHVGFAGSLHVADVLGSGWWCEWMSPQL